MQDETRSPLGLVGFGCVSLLLVSAVALVAFFVVGERMAESVRVQAADPVLRMADAREVLRAAELPAGYAPVLGVSVPLLGRVVVLERPDDLGLLLFLHGRTGHGPERADRLRRLLDVHGLRIEERESLVGGEITEAGRVLAYRSIRARLVSRPRGVQPVVAALVDILCPGETESARLGVWIEADPASWLATEDLDFAGTPGDPDTIQIFFSSFGGC